MSVRKFPGRYDSLEPISKFVIQAAQRAGLDDAAVYAVQLAVDEAATNIIEHGYGGENRGDIRCRCDIVADGLRITLEDQAPPFNPGAVPDPQLNVALDDVRPRGLGLFFMRKMMDEVDFQFSAQGNSLTMLKRRKS